MTSEKQGANEDVSALIPSVQTPSQPDETALAQEAQIAQQVSSGDKNALIALYEKHIDLVFRYFYSKTRNGTEAEDLTSETFTQAIEALMKGRYVWQGKPIRAWLFGIANNVWQERNRRLSNLPQIENMDDLSESVALTTQGADIPDTLVQKEEQAALWGLVNKLPLAEQQVLIMRHVYGLPYSEIARRIKRGEHASKQLHYRALAKLKHLMQGVD